MAKSAAKRRKKQKRKAREKTLRRAKRNPCNNGIQSSNTGSLSAVHPKVDESVLLATVKEAAPSTIPAFRIQASIFEPHDFERVDSTWKPTSLNGQIWSSVLSAVQSEAEKSGPLDLGDWLTSLIPEARKQVRSYRRNVVDINYAPYQAQFAYLLRSFVPYTHLIQLALEEATRVYPPANDLRNCSHLYLLGGGPAPEALGLMAWLSKREGLAAQQPLDVTIIDKYTDAWSWWHSCLNHSVVESVFGQQYRGVIRSQTHDFESSCRIPNQLNCIDHRSPLVMAQNLADELSRKAHDRLVEDFIEVLVRHRHAHLLLVDSVANYNNVQRFYSKSERLLKKLGAYVKREKIRERIPHDQPPILQRTLHCFDTGVSPITNLCDKGFEFLYATFYGAN